ncbi:MAG: hypothetical protein M1816_002922 [Peltula sp. TS41687]|nr:MAG: hypothetical protein M1816_002922 [Peltula sp. TS41687]
MRSLRIGCLVLIAPSFVRSVLATAPEERWPYNLPAHVKYWPEDEVRIRQELAGLEEQDPSPQKRNGLRKMSEDEGEKFYMEYWEFYGGTEPQQQFFHAPSQKIGQSGFEEDKQRLRPLLTDEEEESMGYINGSIPRPFHPPFLVHTEQQPACNPHAKRDFSLHSLLPLRSPEAALEALQKRAFQSIVPPLDDQLAAVLKERHVRSFKTPD